MMRYRKKAAN